MSPGGEERPPWRRDDGGGLERGVVVRLCSLPGGGEAVFPFELPAVTGDGSPLFFNGSAVDGTSTAFSSPAFERRAERRGFLLSASSTVEPFEHKKNQHR